MAVFKDRGQDLSDRTVWDRKRHRQLVEEAIKKNLGDIIAEESIIGQSKEKKVKIPIRGLKEYQFIYGKNSGTGSGTGKEKKGQVIGRAGGDQDGGKGQGGAGNQPGEEYYETEITLEELILYLFEDLKLPDMEKKRFSLVECDGSFKRKGYQLKGIPPRLAKKRTVIEKLKRRQGYKRARSEQAVIQEETDTERFPFREDDLRYYRVKPDVTLESNAVILCIMDTSGSMDQTKKYLARSFYFLLYQFVQLKYEHVEVVFISHTTEAKEVGERDFFQRGESGGTLISSGYGKALEIIESRYSPSLWNIYVFHCTDGDNWSEDNNKAIELAHKLCDVSNLFGYSEINPSAYREQNMLKLFEKELRQPNFIMASISRKEDLWPAFRKILLKEGMTGGDV